MSEPPLWPDGTSIPKDPATTRQDADDRYQRSLDYDPFPNIPEALLNSADVYDYVCATGMVYPFDATCMKGASYEVSIGDCTYWDDDGTPCHAPFADGQSFVLRKNSIVFVTTREEFRLPHYIAIRFNLRITNVHRGILLGTGPLVDPGFAGRLLIPLHDLTTNDYVFRYGERFAWFEFTKISPHDRWRPEYRSERDRMDLRGEYKEFPPGKKWLEPKAYFDKALLDVQPKVIVSSIPESMLKAQRSAENAERHAKAIRNWAGGVGVVALIGIGVVIFQVVQTSWQLVSGIQESVSETRASVAEANTRLDEALSQSHNDIEALNGRASGISSIVEEVRRDVELNRANAASLREQLDEVRSGMEEIKSLLDMIRREDGGPV
jgi:deoxycytidine triphosphate deaminase